MNKFDKILGEYREKDETDITGKASVALDNLASVAINTSLISDTDSTDDLGSITKQWANVHTDRLVSTISNLTIENDLQDGDISFKVNDGGVDKTVMTLDGATGNVGIGTTNPGAKLGFAADTSNTGGIDFGGDVKVYRGSAGWLYVGGSFYANGSFEIGSAIQGSNNWKTLNKAGSGWVTWGTRNTSGSETVLDLSNIGTITTAGNVGIGTTSPTNILSLGGNAVRKIWMERHTTANTAGNTLTIQGGGATSGATNKAGGQLILIPGLSTGTGESGVTIQGCPVGSTGTADGTPADMIKVLGNKLGFYNTTPIARAVLATGASHTVDDVITALQNLGLVSQS